MRRGAKNPLRPPRPLVADADDFLDYSGSLWRIYRTRGPHRQRWNQFRDFGPVCTMRWDPHPLPATEQPDWAVGYAATDVATAFAEVFQDRRAITLSPAQALAGWVPSRPLRLLDLTGPWLLHNNASASLTGGRKDRCRNWSHAIRDTWPDLDGLYVPSSLTNAVSVVLYSPARDAFPADPAVSRPLDSPALAGMIRHLATELQWPIRGGA